MNALNRDSPDESQTGINVRVFPERGLAQHPGAALRLSGRLLEGICNEGDYPCSGRSPGCTESVTSSAQDRTLNLAALPEPRFRLKAVRLCEPKHGGVVRAVS